MARKYRNTGGPSAGAPDTIGELTLRSREVKVSGMAGSIPRAPNSVAFELFAGQPHHLENCTRIAKLGATSGFRTSLFFYKISQKSMEIIILRHLLIFSEFLIIMKFLSKLGKIWPTKLIRHLLLPLFGAELSKLPTLKKISSHSKKDSVTLHYF